MIYFSFFNGMFYKWTSYTIYIQQVIYFLNRFTDDIFAKKGIISDTEHYCKNVHCLYKSEIRLYINCFDRVYIYILSKCNISKNSPKLISI